MFVGAGHLFSGMSIRPDGRRIATREYFDHTIRQWDTESGEPVGTLTGHNSSVTSVEYSPDGRYLASVGPNSALRFLGQASRDPVGEWVDIAALGVVDFVTFSHDGHRFYVIASGWSPGGLARSAVAEYGSCQRRPPRRTHCATRWSRIRATRSGKIGSRPIPQTPSCAGANHAPLDFRSRTMAAHPPRLYVRNEADSSPNSWPIA